MGVILGIDSVYKGPSGSPIALGDLPYAAPGPPMVGLLRPNPFPAGAGFTALPPGWVFGFGNPNAASMLARPNGWPSGQGSISSFMKWITGVNAGNIVYYFAGTQAPGGVLQANSQVPGGGLPEGWYIYQASKIASEGSDQAGRPVPQLGAAPGTSPTDAADFAYAISQLPSWTAGKKTYARNSALSFLTGSGISQVAPGATTTSAASSAASSPLLWVAALAVLGYVAYETL